MSSLWMRTLVKGAADAAAAAESAIERVARRGAERGEEKKEAEVVDVDVAMVLEKILEDDDDSAAASILPRERVAGEGPSERPFNGGGRGVAFCRSGDRRWALSSRLLGPN